MDNMTFKVKVSGTIQRSAGVDSITVSAPPVFKDVVDAIGKEIRAKAGDTVLFTVLCNDQSCMLFDQNAAVKQSDQFSVIPVILGG